MGLSGGPWQRREESGGTKEVKSGYPQSITKRDGDRARNRTFYGLRDPDGRPGCFAEFRGLALGHLSMVWQTRKTCVWK